MTATALTIAGSDPSGGAGLQADLKTFHQHGVYGMSVVTLLTVQNTVGVTRVEVQTPELVAEQLDAVISDIAPLAAKTGALGNAELISCVSKRAEGFSFPLVVDPVMISKHGAALLEENAVAILREKLIPQAFLLTPNVPEAEVLSETSIRDQNDMRSAAERLYLLGAKNVLIKGGHLNEAPVDILFCDGEFTELAGKRIETPHTHGTGCVYSAAITARLARGERLVPAVIKSKEFIARAISCNPGLGAGQGPVNLFSETDK